MDRLKFQIGDKVRVIGIPKIRLPKGMKDELGTKRLFRYMRGRVYTVRGFGKDGHIELKPTRKDVVWIEPELVKLQIRRKRNTGVYA